VDAPVVGDGEIVEADVAAEVHTELGVGQRGLGQLGIRAADDGRVAEGLLGEGRLAVDPSA